MVAILWAESGQVDQAPDWPDLLAKLNALSWNEHLDETEFRVELARRAHVWSGDALVHPEAPAAQLFEELEAAGLLTRLPQRT